MNTGLFWLGMILFLVIIFGGKKKNKSTQQPHHKPPQNEPTSDISAVDVNQDLRKNPQNYPKSEGDFSYETLSDGDFENLKENRDSQNLTVEKNIQSIDNEQLKNIDLQFNTDEIKKGIIYSEILKRPDF